MNKTVFQLSGTCTKRARGKDDRLSSLPDSLLVSILSLLPVEKAAMSSILSHRWRYLWTYITHLDLYHLSRHEVVSYVSTVDRIFERLASNKIHSLHLKIPCLNYTCNWVRDCKSAFEKWLDHICALNVEEIKLSSDTRYGTNNCLPKSTYLCQSLVVLDINYGFQLELPDDGIITLPNLKKLYITDWDNGTMSKLFSSCPVLEVLELCVHGRIKGSLVAVSCQNLRTLKIKAEYLTVTWKCIINAPKLEAFDVEGLVSSFQFVENPCLLTNAKIKLLKFRHNDYVEASMSALVQGICSVESLQLSSIPLYPLIDLEDAHTVPSFLNLSELRIFLNDTSVKNVLSCLHCTPNLKALFIDKAFNQRGVKWVVPDRVPLCLSQKLEKIEVMQLEGSKEELNFLKYILGNANVLKSILVGVSSHMTTQVGKEGRFCMELFSSRKVSKACVIDFRGFVHASSIDNPSSARHLNVKLFYEQLEFPSLTVMTRRQCMGVRCLLLGCFPGHPGSLNCWS